MREEILLEQKGEKITATKMKYHPKASCRESQKGHPIPKKLEREETKVEETEGETNGESISVLLAFNTKFIRIKIN